MIPAAMVLGLKMKKPKKIAVWAVLSLGWVIAIIGAARIVLYYYRFRPSNIDRSYSVAYTISGAEVNMYVSSWKGWRAMANQLMQCYHCIERPSAESLRQEVYSKPAQHIQE
jgi:hypothetical protein